MQTSPAPGRALAFATVLLAFPFPGTGAEAAVRAAAPDSSTTSAAVASDSLGTLPIYRLDPIRVEAVRPLRTDPLRQLPGQTTWVDLRPFQLDLTNTAEVLDQLPGVQVQQFGSLGHLATASIRGSSSSQVSVYLDGIPLTRGGAGLTNLAELPFSGIENIEVYRGFAPSDLPGASTGGAINLVSVGDTTPSGARHGASGVSGASSTLRLGAGSFDTRRLGFSHAHTAGAWNVLVSADAMQSQGDFDFFDDNGTPWNKTDDDHLTPRRNNWVRSEEILARLQTPWRGSRWTLLNHWVRQRQGVAGLSSYQSDTAHLGLTHNLTQLHVRLPEAWGGRLQSGLRLFHDWRRDTFTDHDSDIGLGQQDNKDVSRSLGTQLSAEAHLPVVQSISLLTQVRQETYDAWRRYPQEGNLPQQSRDQLEATFGNRWTAPGQRLALHSTLRLSREHDLFTGDIRSLYSTSAAPAETRHFVEPHLGVRLLLVRGLAAEASYGETHRTPSFLELFGDSGSVAGNSALRPEEGTSRDVGLEWQGRRGALRAHLEAAHYRTRVDHLIVFLPNSQNTFVARNIGSTRMQGEEFSWNLRLGNPVRHWQLQGNVTRQRTEDLGVDISWYAGNELPGRPALQLFTRMQIGWGRIEAGWQFEHLGRNYLDRANFYEVTHRDRHGLDLTLQLQGLRLRGAVRNLNDNKSVDVSGFPLPGRTVSLMTEMAF